MPEVTTPEACQILGVSPQRDASHVDVLTLLAEAKLELERIQKQIFADDSRDVSDVTHIAARLTAFVVHVKDRVRIDCGEIIAIINGESDDQIKRPKVDRRSYRSTFTSSIHEAESESE